VGLGKPQVGKRSYRVGESKAMLERQ
jgi:hypothetical protein